jgi:hypothetical protein
MKQEHEGAGAVKDPEDLTPEEAAAAEALARAQDPPSPVNDEDRAAARRVAQSMPSRAERTDVEVLDDSYDESMDKLRDGVPTDEEDLAAATEWLLSDEQTVNTRKLRIRVGGSDEDPLYVGWVIKAIGVDVIRSAEREASGANRAARRAGSQYDELKANLRIVAQGTVAPDVAAAANAKGMRDPASWLERKFRYRSGVLTQIAGEIMSLSGFDAEDVKAAGN